MTKTKAFLLWLAIANTYLLFAQQNDLAIRNKFLSAGFSPAQKVFEVKDLATGKVFLRKGIANDVTTALPIAVTDSVFGKGQALRLMKVGGGYYTMQYLPHIVKKVNKGPRKAP